MRDAAAVDEVGGLLCGLALLAPADEARARSACVCRPTDGTMSTCSNLPGAFTCATNGAETLVNQDQRPVDQHQRRDRRNQVNQGKVRPID